MYKFAVQYGDIVLLDKLNAGKLSVQLAVRAYHNSRQNVSFEPLLQAAIWLPSKESLHWLLATDVDKHTYVSRIDGVVTRSTPAVVALLEKHGAIRSMLRQPDIVAKAASHRNQALLELAIRHGAIIDAHLHCRETFSLRMRQEADPVAITNRPGSSDRDPEEGPDSAVYYAVRNADSAMHAVLIDTSADMGHEDEHHKSALHLAIRGAVDGSKRYHDILHMLLARPQSTRLISRGHAGHEAPLDTVVASSECKKPDKALQTYLVRSVLDLGASVSYRTLHLLFWDYGNVK